MEHEREGSGANSELAVALHSNAGKGPERLIYYIQIPNADAVRFLDTTNCGSGRPDDRHPGADHDCLLTNVRTH